LIANAGIKDVERELTRLREELAEPGGPPTLRTSSATHVAWVPPEWEAAARAVLDGLAERNPSRVILLLPRPEDPRDELDADVEVRCFAAASVGREVCAEVISIRLNGPRVAAPASVVLPLLVSDLPVFLRWRGDLPLAGEGPAAPPARALEDLLGVADRLIVDSSEWAEPARDLPTLAGLAERVVVSDIAWARTQPWREALAALWPGVADASRLAVAGPEAEARLLAGWLRSRLGRTVELEREPADELERVEVDGIVVVPARPDTRTPSDLLSEQLDLHGRDRIYEDAFRAA
jgi:glucose-6-phosphate dehydrogenase assembly protein OpcA